MEKKKYAWLNSKINSGNTLIQRAKNEVLFLKIESPIFRSIITPFLIESP